ncbi:DUF4097 family beta strand repeat-containing protein [Niameybacter massiliensis]|uniref:DUF4097 family beta strand repeat-containing protein n=1 Tax=Niameybacter massiliensis TaxID=1658108 RepID=UPI0006B5F483|nr:DUF4097 family beta strand repeat-containing protein [Niameybacter massiliensis]
MKALKFFVAGCLVLIGIGVVGTGVTLGEMYKTNQTVYEVNERQELKATALKNLYINSDVPVRIVPTDGQAYVTFEATGNGVMFPEPKFKLDVTSEGDTSRINLKEIQNTEIFIFTNNVREELVVYIPQQDMDTLNVSTNSTNYGRYPFSLSSTANIKSVNLDVSSIDLSLKGSYNNIDIAANNGSVEIVSNTPAQVKLKGGFAAQLKGQIASVDVTKGQYHGSDDTLTIESDLEAKLNINKSYGDIVVDGKVRELNLNTNSSSLVANSSTPYNATVHTSEYTDVNLKGNLQNVIVEGYSGDVKLYPTNTPKRVEILGDEINVHAVLPESITGFEIKKQMDESYYSYEDDYGNTIEETSEDRNIFIDFEVKSENINSGLKRIYYGDEAMKMFIGSRYGNVYITK